MGKPLYKKGRLVEETETGDPQISFRPGEVTSPVGHLAVAEQAGVERVRRFRCLGNAPGGEKQAEENESERAVSRRFSFVSDHQRPSQQRAYSTIAV